MADIIWSTMNLPPFCWSGCTGYEQINSLLGDRHDTALRALEQTAYAVQFSQSQVAQLEKHAQSQFQGCVVWTAWPWPDFVPAPEAKRLVALLLGDYHSITTKVKEWQDRLTTAIVWNAEVAKFINQLGACNVRHREQVQHELNQIFQEIEHNRQWLDERHRKRGAEEKAIDEAEERGRAMRIVHGFLNDPAAGLKCPGHLAEHLLWEFRPLTRQTRFSPLHFQLMRQRFAQSRRKQRSRRAKYAEKHRWERERPAVRTARIFQRMQLQQAAIETEQKRLAMLCHRNWFELGWENDKADLEEQQRLRLEQEEMERQERAERERAIRARQEEIAAEELAFAAQQTELEISGIVNKILKIQDDVKNMEALWMMGKKLPIWLARRDIALANRSSLTTATFPHPPAVTCTSEACDVVGPRLLLACPCNVRNIARLCFHDWAALKKERTRWHPDLFSSCQDAGVKALAREVFDDFQEVIDMAPMPGITFGNDELDQRRKEQEEWWLYSERLADKLLKLSIVDIIGVSRGGVDTRIDELVLAFGQWST